ncbi:MAG TPA: hypothetical protein VMT35_03110 [Ignavibacteriaceae bacterium]|nr:hypothetical protein [Ignavibacteriaceae bacterium]
MQTNSLSKKGLAVGIFLLFIGVAVAPSINSTVVKASNDNDLVEVTSQACGIKEFGNTTVKLTKQQYQNLEQYFVDFRARLNQTTTKDEAIPIFKDAVVELNKYGLLPKGMSIEKAQRLVTIEYRIPIAPNIVKKFTQNSINYDCLFTADLYEAERTNIWSRIASWLTQFYLPYTIGPLAIFFIVFGLVKPFGFNNEIDVYGSLNATFFFSIGSGGIKNGPIYISKVLGFTGLTIKLNNTDTFYLGFALDIQD